MAQMVKNPWFHCLSHIATFTKIVCIRLKNRITLYFGVSGVSKESAFSAGATGDVGSIPGLRDLLEEGITIHSSILAWRNPKTEDPGELWPVGSYRVRHD